LSVKYIVLCKSNIKVFNLIIILSVKCLGIYITELKYVELSVTIPKLNML